MMSLVTGPLVDFHRILIGHAYHTLIYKADLSGKQANFKPIKRAKESVQKRYRLKYAKLRLIATYHFCRKKAEF